jgi:hypothetical protein
MLVSTELSTGYGVASTELRGESFRRRFRRLTLVENVPRRLEGGFGLRKVPRSVDMGLAAGPGRIASRGGAGVLPRVIAERLAEPRSTSIETAGVTTEG